MHWQVQVHLQSLNLHDDVRVCVWGGVRYISHVFSLSMTPPCDKKKEQQQTTTPLRFGVTTRHTLDVAKPHRGCGAQKALCVVATEERVCGEDLKC